MLIYMPQPEAQAQTGVATELKNSGDSLCLRLFEGNFTVNIKSLVIDITL